MAPLRSSREESDVDRAARERYEHILDGLTEPEESSAGGAMRAGRRCFAARRARHRSPAVRDLRITGPGGGAWMGLWRPPHNAERSRGVD